MKKILFMMLSLCLSGVLRMAAQESEVIIKTDLEIGTEFTFNPTLVTSGSNVYIDWGDGNKELAELQTNSWGGTIGYVGTVKGETIHFYGLFKRIDLPEKQITYFSSVGQFQLESLYLTKNKLTNDGLDLSGSTNLKNLDISNNDMTWLKVDNQTQLESIYINDNPNFTTLFIAEPGSEQGTITSISMNNCDVSHFYPIKMPNLHYLNIMNGSLWDIELDDNYPTLSGLNLSGNEALQAVDVTKCTELYSLSLANTAIKELNLSQNTMLTTLDLSNTQIKKLSLINNNVLTSINVSGTDISTLDVSNIYALKDINISDTHLKRLDLRKKRFLRYVRCANTDIEWLDMHHAVGYNQLRELDLRNCKKMTPQSLNFTFDAMPPHNGDSYQVNVFLEGTDYATSKTDLLTDDANNYYKTDFEGDGTAPMAKVDLQVIPTTGGTYKLQRQGEWADREGNDPEWEGYSQYLPFLDIVDNKVIPGRPIRVTDIQPDEGMEFLGLEVNGVFIADKEFQISEAGSVKVIFGTKPENDVIKLTVPSGAEQQYFLGSDVPDAQITVDWGDGVPVDYTINRSTYVGTESGTLGTTVTITGPVTRAIFDSYPYVATDNMITGIDITGNKHLRELSLYMNEIETIDVTEEPDLTFLDVSYTEMETLDISKNTKLKKLVCYGNYISELDLSNAPELTYLDAKNNMLTEIDLSNNLLIDTLHVQNNDIASLEIEHLAKLEALQAQNNELTSINVSNAPNLYELTIGNNQLTKLDISNNSKLLSLDIAGNHIDKLDCSSNPWIIQMNVSYNGWSACTLDDFYESLPEYIGLSLSDEERAQLPKTNLWIDGNFYGSGYDANDVATSNTAIAVAKGWTPNKEGDGTGCNTSIEVVGGNDASVCVENGELLVNTTEPALVCVYTDGGVQIFNATVDGTQAFGLNTGVYIVKVGNSSRTVVVK